MLYLLLWKVPLVNTIILFIYRRGFDISHLVFDIRYAAKVFLLMSMPRCIYTTTSRRHVNLASNISGVVFIFRHDGKTHRDAKKKGLVRTYQEGRGGGNYSNLSSSCTSITWVMYHVNFDSFTKATKSPKKFSVLFIFRPR